MKRKEFKIAVGVPDGKGGCISAARVVLGSQLETTPLGKDSYFAHCFSTGGPCPWTVSHIHTGMAVAHGHTRQEAVEEFMKKASRIDLGKYPDVDTLPMEADVEKRMEGV